MEKVQGYPSNLPYILVNRYVLDVALTAIQLTDYKIDDGFELVIKSDPVNPAAPGGLILIGPTKTTAENRNMAWPLITNEFRSFKVKNANAIWIACTVAPAYVNLSVERSSW